MVRPSPTAERRQEIAAAAAALFDAKGFYETSMEDIASAIGLRKPTLYHYVQSKAQLVSWIHDECVQAVLPPLREYVANRLPAQDILLLVATDILGLLETKPGYLRVFFENHRQLPGPDKARAGKLRDEYYSLVKQVLSDGRQSGEFWVQDPGLAALEYFGMCNWAYQWYRPGGALSAQELAKDLWRNFLLGAAAPAASGREVGFAGNGVPVGPVP